MEVVYSSFIVCRGLRNLENIDILCYSIGYCIELVFTNYENGKYWVLFLYYILSPLSYRRNPVIKLAMVKNTEQKELETIAQFRQKLSKQLKQNQESYKKAVEAPSYAPAHSKSKPTQPHEFRFQTDNRLKNQQTEIQSTSPVDYVRTLRSETNKPTVSTCIYNQQV